VKKAIRTAAAPAAVGPYSQAIQAGDFLFISGQIGIDPATKKLVEGGIEAQAERVLKNLAAIVAEVGGTMESIVKTTVFLQSMADFSKLNEIYARFFGETPPARATFEVAKLPLGALVEIEAVCWLGR
jgi:2-iminobutanoate/2-iminopropanoate deaminase